MAQPAKKKQKCGLSSASGMLRGMRFPGGKFPGHRVVEEVRKGAGDVRVVKFFGGQTKKISKREVAELARDRGYDLSMQRFAMESPEGRERMLQGSVQWQRQARKRWIQRFEQKLDTVKSPQKRKRLESQLETLRRVRPRSPLTGAKPVSGYLRRFWD